MFSLFQGQPAPETSQSVEHWSLSATSGLKESKLSPPKEAQVFQKAQEAMASNQEAMACNLSAMASNVRAGDFGALLSIGHDTRGSPPSLNMFSPEKWWKNGLWT